MKRVESIEEVICENCVYSSQDLDKTYCMYDNDEIHAKRNNAKCSHGKWIYNEDGAIYLGQFTQVIGYFLDKEDEEADTVAPYNIENRVAEIEASLLNEISELRSEIKELKSRRCGCQSHNNYGHNLEEQKPKVGDIRWTGWSPDPVYCKSMTSVQDEYPQICRDAYGNFTYMDKEKS